MGGVEPDSLHGGVGCPVPQRHVDAAQRVGEVADPAGDSVDHDLVVKAVRAHTDLPWVVLYVRRWLTAPMQHPDGTLRERDRGTPQGSAVSPVLANLFLHYAFDTWMARRFPTVRFERYVDDVVVHCVSEPQARMSRAAIADRMAEVGLQLHPDKTTIVYCKDSNRRLAYANTAFTFLGFTFRPHVARGTNTTRFTSFLPAISKEALNKISRELRHWRLHRLIGLTFTELARKINPVVRGWMQYYGAFYRSALHPFLQRVNAYQCDESARNTNGYARSRRPKRAGTGSLPSTQACSRTGSGPAVCDQDGKSRVTGDFTPGSVGAGG